MHLPLWAFNLFLDSSCCCSLLLEFPVEVVSCVGARHVVSVPVETAHGGTDSEGNGEVSDEAPSEHTSNRFDGHFECEPEEED
ncbi:hypothetical protein F5Y06DRAFT_257389 [Hypoxylon sp. FL0890]|nr:hypothetical protein F5Y06DRAFT_257389 [Hypoxylon sp. FL0890]